MVFVNPSTSGFYQDVGAAKIMFFTLQVFLCYKLPTSHCAFLTETLSESQFVSEAVDSTPPPPLSCTCPLCFLHFETPSALKYGLSSCQPSILPVCVLVFITLLFFMNASQLIQWHEQQSMGVFRMEIKNCCLMTISLLPQSAMPNNCPTCSQKCSCPNPNRFLC